MITSVMVANRGEIARRVFRTCRELGLATVAVHSDADADAPFVREADRAVRLPGDAPADTYLRADLLVQAALTAGADAVHPGYGFLSENAAFARAVLDAGLTWIGPDPATIEAMGSKIRAKELMAAAGVPVLEVDPAAAGPDDFPLLVKASSGGGGRGMRVVEHPDDLERVMEQASAEAASAFGDPTVFVEPYLPGARHVEVQVMADRHGTVWVVGDRDCSIQRRHQKVVEEAPAPGLADATRTALHEAARAAAKAVDYVGAGTVEMLVDGTRFFFLEMNTRLQVEHPVTEMVFGVDLVARQVAVAEGAALGHEPDGPHGHAVEVRLYAEDPARDFAPQTGTIRAFSVPTPGGGPGPWAAKGTVRVDAAVEPGSVVTPHYDAMIAKIVAHDVDRAGAIRRLVGALRRTRVHGVTTNLDLLLRILPGIADPADLSTALLEERLQEWTSPRLDEATVGRMAFAAATYAAADAAASSPVQARIPAAFRNVPSQPRTRVLRHGEREIAVEYTAADLRGVRHQEGRVVLDDDFSESFEVTLTEGWIDVDGPQGSVSFEVVPTFVDPADVVAQGSLLAPMPGSVVRVDVEQGQAVAKGDPVVVLEAMKMQHTITAPTDGVVSELAVTAGAQVESGAVLAVIEEQG